MKYHLQNLHTLHHDLYTEGAATVARAHPAVITNDTIDVQYFPNRPKLSHWTL